MRPVVVQRWIVCAAQAHAREPCVELRLRERTDTRAAKCAPAQPDRRTHARKPARASGTPLVQCQVISALADAMVLKAVPEHLRSDNGPEFVAKDLRKWLANTAVKTLYIELGLPWENGYCESFNSKLRDELLNGEIFYSMKELRVLAERWSVHSNTIRPHSSLGYRPPAPQTRMTNNKGHGEVETPSRFPLLHPPTATT